MCATLNEELQLRGFIGVRDKGQRVASRGSQLKVQEEAPEGAADRNTRINRQNVSRRQRLSERYSQVLQDFSCPRQQASR